MSDLDARAEPQSRVEPDALVVQDRAALGITKPESSVGSDGDAVVGVDSVEEGPPLPRGVASGRPQRWETEALPGRRHARPESRPRTASLSAC